MKMKLIISGIMLTLLCLLGGCDDKLEVQQAYDFSLTSWYHQIDLLLVVHLAATLHLYITDLIAGFLIVSATIECQTNLHGLIRGNGLLEIPGR